MTTEEKFYAAVNVIRSLPKNGSYQPSNELMLRFYSYFKQATEGPCAEAKCSKPAFWDVVGRAKHTAWGRLKNMPRDEAMRRYVDELHRIVETMSYTDNVASFMQAGDQEVLDSLPMDDLELVAGDCLQYVRSQPGSPLVSRPSSPAVPLQADSDDEYIDTEEPESDAPFAKETLTNGMVAAEPAHSTTIPNGVAGGKHRSKAAGGEAMSGDVARLVAALQADVRALETRVGGLEQQQQRAKGSAGRRHVSVAQLSPALLALLLVWPFVAIRLSQRWSNK